MVGKEECSKEPYSVVRTREDKVSIYGEILAVGFEYLEGGEIVKVGLSIDWDWDRSADGAAWGDGADESGESVDGGGEASVDWGIVSDDVGWAGGADGAAWGEDVSAGGGVHALAGGILAYVRRDAATRDFMEAAQEAYEKQALSIGLVSLLLCIPHIVSVLRQLYPTGHNILEKLLSACVVVPALCFVVISYVAALVWICPRTLVSFRLGKIPKKEAKTPLLVSVVCFSLFGVVCFLSPLWKWMFFPVLLLYGFYHLVQGLGIWFYQDRVFQSRLYLNCFGLYVLFLFPVVMPFVIIRAMS